MAPRRKRGRQEKRRRENRLSPTLPARERGRRPEATDPDAPVVVVRLANDTVAPACVRALRAMGRTVTEIVLEERPEGGVRLVTPESWEGVILLLLRRPPAAILLVDSRGFDDGRLWLAVAELLGTPVVNWFVDCPRMCPLPAVERRAECLALAVWDAAYLEETRRLGFRNVFHLPLGADPGMADRLDPAPLEPPCDVAFVGSLGNHRIRALRGELERARERGGRPAAEEAEALIARGRGWMRENPGRSVFDYVDAVDAALLPADPDAAEEVRRVVAAIVDFEVTREDRLAVARALADRGLAVWGDRAWRDEIPSGQFRGFIGYDDVGRVYRDAKIVVNVSRGQLLTTVNQRVFDVPTCGGFLITDARPAVGEFVEPGVEMEVYRDPGELPALVERYLGDDAARREMAARARERLARDHSYLRRMEALLEQTGAMVARAGRGPLDPEWEWRLWRVYLAIEPREEAGRETIELIERLEERGATTPYGRTMVAWKMGQGASPDPEGMCRILKEVCAETDLMSEARLLLFNGLEGLQRREESLAVIEAVPEEKRTASDWFCLGVARLRRRERAGAIDALDRTLELDPHNEKALMLLERLTEDESLS